MGRESRKEAATVLLGGGILMLFAFYNGYPLMTPDTGAYLFSGFDGMVPGDRPVYYGLLVRLASLGETLWLPIYVQCALVAWCLRLFLRGILPGLGRWPLTGFYLFCSLLTWCGWFASQLIPDIFTGVLPVAAVVVLCFPQSRLNRALLLLLLLICAVGHNSNFVQLTVFGAILTALGWIKPSWRPFRKNGLAFLGIGMLAWGAVATSNWVAGNGFVSSKSTHVFLMAKLSESGLLRPYLEEVCPTENYRLCKYKDNLPYNAIEFHWSDNSPVQREGGWDANREEYERILKGFFSRPGSYPKFFYKAATATLRQLSQYQLEEFRGEGLTFGEGSPPYVAVEKHLRHELGEFRISRQNEKRLDTPFFTNVFLLVLVASCVALLGFLPPSLRQEYRNLALLLALLLVLNAAITATLSTVHWRFHSRVLWVVPLLNVACLWKAYGPDWRGRRP